MRSISASAAASPVGRIQSGSEIEVVAFDADADLALLRIRHLDKDRFPHLELAFRDALFVAPSPVALSALATAVALARFVVGVLVGLLGSGCRLGQLDLVGRLGLDHLTGVHERRYELGLLEPFGVDAGR